MRVFINQTPHELPTGATLADAVAASGASGPFAAAVNLQFVPKTRYAQTPLAEGDQIEIIAPVTGG
ncbi:MAG TPA: sulfur carrier protein ThiS [Macromonas sp.]|nr:sulfur carrier protein ThiS [Macromonas sp.]